MTPAKAPNASATPGALALSERLRALSARPEGLRVSELIDRYMAQYAGRDTSRTQRLSAWRDMIGEFALEAVDADLVYAGRAELATQAALTFKGRDHAGRRIFKPRARTGKKSTATLNRYLVAIAAVFTWAIEARLAPKGFVHPCRGIKRLPEADGRVRFLDADERARLFASCRASRYPRLHALVLTAMLTGARRGELLGLRWANVDLEAGIASLGNTKNGDRRTLILLPQVIEVLRPFASSDRARFVFGSVRTRYQSAAVTDSAWRDAVARAGVRDFRFHDLRHCCASYLAQYGVSINVIAEILGQRKLDMARRYSHLTTQTKAQAMRAALGEIK